MSPVVPTMPAVGDVLLGRFRLESILGEGEMGRVFSAYQLTNDTIVAIKVLSSEASTHPEAMPRFVNEATATAQLHSPHVVKVFEAGTTEQGLPFIVMELLEGADLGMLVERRRHLPIAEAVDYIIQASDAVAEAHAHGIIHRDLKPSNLFLSTGAGTGGAKNIIKVLDFGVSKISGSIAPQEVGLTATGAFLGSPHYMAPEQLKSAKDVDARADIWSLGVILYELVSGRTPFDAEAYGELFVKVLAAEFVPLRETRLNIPEGLDQVVGRCLRKAREERFSDLTELVVALAPFASPDGKARAKRVGKPGEHPPLPKPVPPPPSSDRKLATTALMPDWPGPIPPPATIVMQDRPGPVFVPSPRSVETIPSSSRIAKAKPSSGSLPDLPPSSPALPSFFAAGQASQSNPGAWDLVATVQKPKIMMGVVIAAVAVAIIGLVLIVVALVRSPSSTSTAATSASSTSASASPVTAPLVSTAATSTSTPAQEPAPQPPPPPQPQPRSRAGNPKTRGPASPRATASSSTILDRRK